MKPFLKAIAATMTFASILSSTASMATTVDTGTLNSTINIDVFNHVGVPSSFFDTVNFDVLGPSILHASFKNLQQSFSTASGTVDVLNIAGLSAAVWDNHHPDGINSYGSFNVNDLTFSFNLPSSGLYHIDFTGTTTGLAGGLYSVALNAVPVPEPESYALLLSGLGLMGMVAMRRRIK